MGNDKKLSPTKAVAAKVMHAAFVILRENGNEMPMRELMTRVEKQVEFDDWEKAPYEKSGYIRWESIFHFASIRCVKAGFLIKKKGIWYLTPEGEEATNLSPEDFIQHTINAYRKWKAEHPKVPDTEEPEEGDAEDQTITYEEVEQIALEGIEKYIRKLNPYEFQDVVAALLRGMGYYTPFVAPRGKDGGADVIAYRDPLGTESPRIKVQVKNRTQSASVQEVRQLMGLLQKDGDVGIFVSTGGFTPDAKRTARSSHVHVELINLNRFIGLWQDFYEKLSDEDKIILPLTPIYFLANKD